MVKQYRYIISLIFIITGLSISAMEYSNDINKTVLILNSYHNGFLWSDEITRGISNVLSDKNIELHIEYMDSKRQWNTNYINALSEILILKFNRHNYDLIITSDDNAFNYAVQNRDRLFAGIPIVFCGLNFLNPNQLSEYSNITGVNETIDIIGNIDLIRSLHPELENLVIITDDTTTGRKLQTRLNEVTPLYPNTSIDIVYDISGNDLIELVKNSSLNTIFLFTLFFTDNEGVFYDDMINKLSAVSKTPIYGAWDFNMNNGIIGGVLTDGYSQGTVAGELGLRVLSGEDLDDIAIKITSPTEVVFDYKELKRFNINIDNIDFDKLINKPESFYYKYRDIILIVALLLIILTISLLSVSIFLIRSKQAENRLTRYKMNLEDIISERTKKLQTSLEDLKSTQDKLVETQKMAYLGSLVAGVAHEMNTPLGVGITSISHQITEINGLENIINNNKLKKSELDEYLLNSKQSLESSLSSLQRAAEIINRFKLVAIDQTEEIKQIINIHDFLTNLIVNIFSKEFNDNFRILLFCNNDIEIETFPEAILVLFKNLITNSFNHGFKDSKFGVINMEVIKNNGKLEIKYYDSGFGISDKNIKHVFNPFYTTGRVDGHLGLGLNIVYNVVVNQLEGSIKCQNDTDGNTFFLINI